MTLDNLPTLPDISRDEYHNALERAAKRICEAYGIRGTCDPGYIANLIANETGTGDGLGEIYPPKDATLSRYVIHVALRNGGSFFRVVYRSSFTTSEVAEYLRTQVANPADILYWTYSNDRPKKCMCQACESKRRNPNKRLRYGTET